MPRPPGAKNKRDAAMRFDLIQTLKAKNFDPVAALVETHAEAMKQYRKRTHGNGTGFGGQGYLSIARESASGIMEYVYPKLKSVEMSGKDGADLFQSLTAVFKRVIDESKGDAET